MDITIKYKPLDEEMRLDNQNLYFLMYKWECNDVQKFEKVYNIAKYVFEIIQNEGRNLSSEISDELNKIIDLTSPYGILEKIAVITSFYVEKVSKTEYSLEKIEEKAIIVLVRKLYADTLSN